MDETYTTTAFILSRQAFRERDSRIVAYSPDRGRLELVARGTKSIKSKLAGHLEPVTLARIMVVRGRRFDYVASASADRSFLNIKSDVDKMNVAGRAINELLRLIKPGEADPAVFNLLISLMNNLDAYPIDGGGHEIFDSYFSFKLLTLLGYAPELYQCVKCRRKLSPQGNFFSALSGGIICPLCAKKSTDHKDNLTISENCIKILRLVSQKPFDLLFKLKIEKKLIIEIKNIISSFENSIQ